VTMTEEHIRFLTDTAKEYSHPIGFIREPSVSEPNRCFVYIIFMTEEKSKDMAMIANGNADDTFTDMETMKVYTMEELGL